jgi:tRNA nucleotidyltransferase (CCA-adding enzyme)
VKKVLTKVLRKIEPPPEDTENAGKIFEELRDKIHKVSGRKAIMVGSIAKDTHILGQRDIDIFILFPENLPNDILEKEGLSIAKKVLKGRKKEEHWAQHPYLISEINGFKVEIVPCYAVKSPTRIKSAVDRTPFHKEYVLAKLNKKMRDGTRLFKAFLRGAEVYGAEERVQGFSGYLCELLIMHYGGFENFVRAASEWSKTEIIDLEGAHPNRKKLVKKFGEGLIVIDPVDSNRNVASAVSEKSLALCIEHCRKFLKKPNERLFTPPKVTPLKQSEITRIIKKKGMYIVVVKFKKPDVIEEILYSQLRKSLGSLRKQLEVNEFRVHDADFFEDGKYCYFVIETIESELPSVRLRRGPPVYERIDEERFLEKHKGGRTWIVDDKWVAEVNRKCITPEQCLKQIINAPNRYGIGSYLLKPIKSARILKEKTIKDMPVEFTRYLVKQ